MRGSLGAVYGLQRCHTGWGAHVGERQCVCAPMHGDSGVPMNARVCGTRVCPQGGGVMRGAHMEELNNIKMLNLVLYEHCPVIGMRVCEVEWQIELKMASKYFVLGKIVYVPGMWRRCVWYVAESICV